MWIGYKIKSEEVELDSRWSNPLAVEACIDPTWSSGTVMALWSYQMRHSCFSQSLANAYFWENHNPEQVYMRAQLRKVSSWHLAVWGRVWLWRGKLGGDSGKDTIISTINIKNHFSSPAVYEATWNAQRIKW